MSAPPPLPPPPPGKRGWPWTEPPPSVPAADDPAEWPAIGIITPSFNQGPYIEETIRSVLLQDYPNLEYFIEDGGSKDGTGAVLEKYASRLTGAVSEPDRGQSHAINKGMAKLRRAEWAVWLNSDDILLPGALRAVGRWAARGPAAAAVLGAGEHWIERRRRLVSVPPPERVDSASLRDWRRNAILQPACFFRLAAFRAAGGLDESLRYAMDFALWLDLAERGGFDTIPDLIARDRIHPDAKTQRAMGECYGEIGEILFKRGCAEDARRLIAGLYEELSSMNRTLSPILGNPLYLRLLRPLMRRWMGRR